MLINFDKPKMFTVTCFVFGVGRALGHGRQNGFIRIAPAQAVTDCHYALPDRWSCGEK